MNDKTEMPQEAARPKRKFGPSTVARLQVARVSEMGAFLDAQTGNTSDDILLHKTQQTHPVAVGNLVDVFLYLDPKRRLTASMRVPKMKEGQIARLRVINVTRDGAFLDVGAERGIFMPYAGMRGRPQGKALHRQVRPTGCDDGSRGRDAPRFEAGDTRQGRPDGHGGHLQLHGRRGLPVLE